MQNLKVFQAFVKKEFFHIFRDVRTMMIVLLMPIVQMLLFGFALNMEVSNIKFSALDFSHSRESKSILQALDSNPYFSLTKNIESKENLRTIFNDNHIDMVVIFNADFTKTGQIQLLLDSSDPNRASTINMYATQIITKTLRELSPTSAQPLPIIPHITMAFNPQGKSSFNFVPGLLGMIIMLICAMMTSISIVREKEQGSMQILLTSPLSPMLMIIAKIVPYFCISCLSLCIVLVLSTTLMGLEIRGNLLTLLLFCMLYIILALSIGIFISNLAKTQLVAMLVSGMVFIMPIMLLSGLLFPTESMPKILQYFSHIIPTKWFIIGLKSIMLQGLGFVESAREWAILGGMLCVILLLSMKTFKTRIA